MIGACVGLIAAGLLAFVGDLPGGLPSAAGGGLIPSIDATFGHPSGRPNHRCRGRNETASCGVLSCQPGRVRGSRPRNRSWENFQKNVPTDRFDR
jgi:hypothetical protein